MCPHSLGYVSDAYLLFDRTYPRCFAVSQVFLEKQMTRGSATIDPVIFILRRRCVRLSEPSAFVFFSKDLNNVRAPSKFDR
ncbi:hypothetical protein SCLCIDRAFT_1220259 [Scleroderma citrinum Foug A]|uniref:Uncharacterized protein n=1 Tax=Scleroderma citrinum Foug A TaxID=1036808 RepID=A0A0C3DKJ1_9AGAM|nr:hypothetical protein SCLCIDRAFT_1220259 [Scleroderma citrinum Foug A]